MMRHISAGIHTVEYSLDILSITLLERTILCYSPEDSSIVSYTIWSEFTMEVFLDDTMELEVRIASYW
jgi:hypothetical protein